MDEKMKNVIAGILNNLTDEQKKKATACKSLDELTACLGELGVALPDELLDAVAGGIVWDSLALMISNGAEPGFSAVENQASTAIKPQVSSFF